MNEGDTPGVKPVPMTQVKGSIAQAAAAKTMTDAAQHAAAFKELGAGQKGAARRRRMRGGATEVQPLNIPTAGTVPGQTPTSVAKNLSELQAQVKANGTYDKLATSVPPIMLNHKGGFLKELLNKRKTKKKKDGRRHRRTRRGKRNNRRSLRRRSHRRV